MSPKQYGKFGAGLFLGIVMGLVFGGLLKGSARAAGQSRAHDPDVSNVATTTAKPVRPVILRAVTSKPFSLPNGGAANLSADLDLMLQTAVTETSLFAPADPRIPADCDEWVEIRAGVSTLELNVSQFGLKIGYSPSGSFDAAGLRVQGEVDVKVGTIAMDFSVWNCSKERGEARCAAVAAATANHNTTTTSLGFKLNFSVIQIGPELVHNSPLGRILRDIMKSGISSIVNHPRTSEIGWRAVVMDVSPDGNFVTFSSGSRSRIGLNQVFMVYAAADSNAACQVYKSVAYIKTNQVDPVSSIARVEQFRDSRGVKVGDIVMVQPAEVLGQ